MSVKASTQSQGSIMPENVYQAPHISPQEYEKFRGKHVALHKGKIIADGSNSVETLRKALKTHPKLKSDQIGLFYIQVADVLIL